MIICPVDIMIQGKSWRRGIHLVCMHWRGGGGSHENQCHSAYSNAFAVHYFICEMHTVGGRRGPKTW